MKHSGKYLQVKARLDSKEHQLKHDIATGSSKIKRIGYWAGLSAFALLIIRILFFKKRRAVSQSSEQAKIGNFFRYQIGKIVLGIIVERVAEYWSKKSKSGLKH